MAFCDIWQKMVMRNADGVLLLQKSPAAARKDGVDRGAVLW